MNVFMTVIS